MGGKAGGVVDATDEMAEQADAEEPPEGEDLPYLEISVEEEPYTEE